MADHLCIDAATGTLAVWTGGTDLGPVTNPASFTTRVRFHSRQQNAGFHPERTGSVSIANWAAGTGELPNVKRTMFAHGLGYRPLLIGYLNIGGTPQPINGSVFHHAFNDQPTFFSYTVGADNTNVYLNIMRTNPNGVGSLPSTISYAIRCSTYGLTSGGALRRPAYFNGVDINDGAAEPYVKAGYFDTQYRYPYRNNSSNYKIPRGRTMSTGIGFNQLSGGTGTVALGWRYSVNGRVFSRNTTNIGSPAVGNSTSFNATLVGVSF